MPLRRLHRTSAIMIAAFAFFHIANHLASLSGVATHVEFMRVARLIYRQPIVEGLLLFCVGVPVSLGAAISLVIVLSLAGHLQPVETPVEYKATYLP